MTAINHKKPIKVLEVIRQGQIGGGETHLLDLVSHFNPQEVEAVVLSFTGGPMVDTLRQKGIKTYIVETSYPFDPRISKKIKTIIQSEKICLIHAHGSRAASNVVFLAHKLHIPFIYTVHGWSFHQSQSPLIYRLRCLSEKLICRYTKQVICVSESNRLTGEKNFGLKKATVIENGINLEKFDPDKASKNIREELGFQPDDLIVGFIARLTLQKAPLDFIKSILLAHKELPALKALIVGEGDQQEEMQAFIQAQNARSYIITTPFRQDVPDLLHAIDIFCLPSLWEGLSISLLEAMAMKKALVVTPTDGTRELITHERNGLIAPFSSPEKLALCYIQYARHPELMDKYAFVNRQIIEQRFDCRRVSEKVTELYKTYIQ